MAQVAIRTLLDITAYHRHPVRAGYLWYVGHAQRRVSACDDPSGCRCGSLSGRYIRRSGTAGGPTIGTLSLYLWGSEPCKNDYHFTERHVHRDGEAER